MIKNKHIKNTVLGGIYLALLIISAQITFPIGGSVNFTLQILVLLIICLSTDIKISSLVVIGYVLGGVIGLPFFSNFQGGFHVVLLPNFGFLLGFTLTPFIIHSCKKLLSRLKIHDVFNYFISSMVGIICCYIVAIIYVYFMLVGWDDMNKIFTYLFAPYILLDIGKGVIAVIIGLRLSKILSTTKEYKFKILDNCDSTNFYAKENYKEFDDKTVIFTTNQTKGRGRFDRVWLSTNSVCMTIIFKSNLGFKYDTDLCVYYSVACLNVLKKILNNVYIKWPNDVYILNKKIAGILIEGIIEEDNKVFFGGIGININEEFNNELNSTATSLIIENKKYYEPNMIAIKFLDELFYLFNKVSRKKVFRKYLKYSNVLGKVITFNENSNTYIGKVIEIIENGGIKIDIDGEIKIYHSGEISLKIAKY